MKGGIFVNRILQKLLLGMTFAVMFGGGIAFVNADDVYTRQNSSNNNILVDDTNLKQASSTSEQISSTEQISSSDSVDTLATSKSSSSSIDTNQSTSSLQNISSQASATTYANEESAAVSVAATSSSATKSTSSAIVAKEDNENSIQNQQTGRVLANDSVVKAARNNNAQVAKQAADNLLAAIKNASQYNLTFYNDVDEPVVGFNGKVAYNNGYNYNYEDVNVVKYNNDTRNDKYQVVNDYANLSQNELKEINIFAAQLLNTVRESVWALYGQDTSSWQLMITNDSMGLAVKVAQGYTRDRHSISSGTHDVDVLKEAYKSYGLHGYSENYGSTSLNYAANMVSNRKTTMYDLKKAIFQTITLMLYDDMPAASGGANAGSDGNGHAYSLAYGWNQYSFDENYFGVAFDQMGQLHIVNFKPSLIWNDTHFNTNKLVYTKTLGDTSGVTKSVPTAYSNYLKASVFNNDATISYVKEKIVDGNAYYFVTRNGQLYIYDSNLTRLKGQIEIGDVFYNLNNSTGAVLSNGSVNSSEVKQRLAKNDNKANFDSVTINGTNLVVRGWHAADASIVRPYAYIILFDKSTNRELRRIAYTPLYRVDVARVYPGIYNAANSGFSVNIDLRGLNFAGHQLQLVTRYSDDRAGNGNTTDIWSGNYTFNTNAASFDSVTINGTNLTVRGWHIADAAANKGYAYIILFDKSTNRELRRVAYKPYVRQDVANVYHNVYNAANGGFNVNIDLRGLNFAGHQLQLVTRYSNDRAGNGSMVDIWSGNYVFNTNAASFDSVTINGTNLTVRGWHIADAAANKGYAYIILFDKSANRELRRVAYTPYVRQDVANVYHNVYNAANGGFSVNIDLRGLNFAGHQLQLVTRYSDDRAGNGNTADIWSGNYVFNTNAGNVDSVKKVNSNTLSISGWHVADASATQPYAWLIVLDKTTGRELTRTRYVVTTRNDVYTAFNNVYSSKQSGFSNVNVKLPVSLNSINGHDLQVVARYSNNSYNGEGSRTDFYSRVFKFRNGVFYL